MLAFTPVAKAADPVIAAAGDIGCDPSDSRYNNGNGTADACRQKYTSDLLVGAGLTSVLPLGDNQYDDGTLAKFQAVYGPTWGRVKSITRPVAGNHEPNASDGYATGYFDYFNGAGNSNGPAGERGKGYYSFDIGGWHLIALNSNCAQVPCSAGSTQEQWLRADLAAHPNSCTIAYWHHARFSSGHDGDNTFVQSFWQALYEGGADIVLNGHSHDYERFAPMNAGGNLDNARGIREFVVGTGGAFWTGLADPKPNSMVRQNIVYGVLKITLHPGSYDWHFVPEAGKTFTDSGSANCHAAGYARPLSATPITTRLVPAYTTCTSANATHGAPLASPSCTPPVATSGQLTVGSPDANGRPAGSTGLVRLQVIGESPIDPSNGDQADVRTEISLTDVLRRSDLADYAGELEAVMTLRITDRLNGPSLTDPATTVDVPLRFTVPCAATAAGEGGSCQLVTTADAVLNGVVREGKRSVWELRNVSIYDGGPDGRASTADNTLFADQGTFAP
jgi:acid phosphatase type 7